MLKKFNALNEINNIEIIIYKKSTPGHKKLLNLFNDLWDIILTNKTLESESQENKNEKENENVNENDENENENEDDDVIIKKLLHSNQYAETVDQNEKNLIIKKLNDHFDKIIDNQNHLKTK